MNEKITKIGKPECKIVRRLVEKAINEALEEFGLSVDTGNMTFTGDTVSFKTTVSVDGYDADEKEFNRACYNFGLEPKHRGMYFQSNGESYELIAIKPRSRKYPFVGRRTDGKKYKFGKFIIRQLLEQTEAA